MTTGSRKTVTPAGSPPEPDSGGDGTPGAPGPSDAYVERLGDRISSQHGLPEMQAAGGFGAPNFVPMHEASDVHTLPAGDGGGDDDEALDLPPLPPAEPADAFAEFEDEMEGETTRIDDSHLLAEQSTAILEDVPAQPFLLVERGPDKGREFVLQEGENGIGRGIDNDVILADVAVSRRHLVVVREGETLRLRDLGSGNGTQVNGKRVSSMVLADGDRIELGETVMAVRTPGGTQAPLDPDAATDESHIGGSLPRPPPSSRRTIRSRCRAAPATPPS
ncbi:MAG: FHA domain-containing protein [Sandaracinaceae bacterium]|nr:FHA domain-containing protein [Sandaracinaceae bacterium]